MTPAFRLTALCSVIAMAGCASLPPGRQPDPTDPFERYNRAAYAFNDALDRGLIKPVAQAYQAVTPEFARRGVSNFFGNLSDVPTAVNDVLQGKGKLALTHTGRFLINSTVGVLGLFDVATPLGLSRQREDFGQTLGTWGLDSGPYLILPLLGPSSVRDAAGLPVDFALDPLSHLHDDRWLWGLEALRVVDKRASVLGIEKTLQSVEIDPYLFTRDAYLARRRNAVYDGNPPDAGASAPAGAASAASGVAP